MAGSVVVSNFHYNLILEDRLARLVKRRFDFHLYQVLLKFQAIVEEKQLGYLNSLKIEDDQNIEYL